MVDDESWEERKLGEMGLFPEITMFVTFTRKERENLVSHVKVACMNQEGGKNA